MLIQFILTLLIPVCGLTSFDGPPNLVLLTADDLGYGDLNHPMTEMPNVNDLIRDGLFFTQFYTPGPLCTPSRSSMLTGRLPIRSGLYTNLDYPVDNEFRVFYPTSTGCLPKSETMISEYLKNSPLKYSTAMLGKWHLGHNNFSQCMPMYRGFDVSYYLPYSH